MCRFDGTCTKCPNKSKIVAILVKILVRFLTQFAPRLALPLPHIDMSWVLITIGEMVRNVQGDCNGSGDEFEGGGGVVKIVDCSERVFATPFFG